MLVGDVTAPDPIEALLDMGNTPKVGVVLVLIFREALETNWQPLLHRDNVNVLLNPGKAFFEIGNPLRDPEPCSRTSLYFGSLNNNDNGRSCGGVC